MGGVGFEPITNDGTVDEDQALTEEARSEKWESSSATFHQTAGVFDGLSSSEILGELAGHHRGPVRVMHLMYHHLHHALRLSTVHHHYLIHRALGQVSANDTGLRVCQYEVPGGGVCRDKNCNDLHLSRLMNGCCINS
ncbi:hypothetical protein EDD22DRAFT_434033 [Suillus occidentalis]|nr:hypothetical protein EDD22DRAFT_434033 [Suillus occidentalis]